MDRERFQALFPKVKDEQWDLLSQWSELMRNWNEKINLVSRKDIAHLEERHMAHCLAITEHLELKGGARCLDVGTGGGLPGLLMAICYPKAEFTLIDSIGKKVAVVQALIDALGLKNAQAKQMRAEELSQKYDFITGRAVKSLPLFLSWIQNNIRVGKTHSLKNGVLYWKGDAYLEETDSMGLNVTNAFDLGVQLKDEFFSNKYIIHIEAEMLKKAKF